LIVTDVVIDAHFHLLQTDIDYPWMAEEFVRPLETQTIFELENEFIRNGVVGGVAVQAASDIQETMSLLRVAETNPLVLGVVGWLDLTNSKFRDDLKRMLESPGGNLLVGLRHQVHDEDDPSWLSRVEVRKALERIADTGLAFDLLIRQREISAARNLAAALPQLKLVVDHLAKPVLSLEVYDKWRDDLASLAEFPNVYCKLSGLVTETSTLGGWRIEQLEPFLRAGLEMFGAPRCLFGSDWPICRLAATYSQVLELLSITIAPLPVSDRNAVLFQNAVDVYGLNVDDLMVVGR
jgi:L-fuconolactonase